MLRLALSAGIALVLLPLVPIACRAQDYRGRAQGSVFDETRAVLPGVTITLRNDATGYTHAARTDLKMYGGTVGLPIVKNPSGAAAALTKTFTVGLQEKLRLVFPNSVSF